MARHTRRVARTLSRRTAWLLALGGILIAAGLICNTWLPINKKLWTSSFALFMAGPGFAIFAVMLWWGGVCGDVRFLKTLLIMGIEAIKIFLLSELLAEVLKAFHFSLR